MKREDPFDLDNYIIETIPKAAPKSVRRPKAEADFICLPLPLATLLGGKATGAAWAVLACLIEMEFQTWNKGQPLILSSDALQKWCVSHDQKRRALTKLETLGLIYVERKPGSDPRVTLTYAKTRR